MCTFHWLESGCIRGVSEDRVHCEIPLCGLKNLYSRSPQDPQPLVWGAIFDQQAIIKGLFWTRHYRGSTEIKDKKSPSWKSSIWWMRKTTQNSVVRSVIILSERLSVSPCESSASEKLETGDRPRSDARERQTSCQNLALKWNAALAWSWGRMPSAGLSS